MPVLIEGVCVLLKKGAVIERYHGGYGQFIFDLHDQSKLWESESLLSVGFENHEGARKYLDFLVQRGLKVMLLNEENPNNTDAILVDQVFGPSFRVYWLDFIHLSPNASLKLYSEPKKKKSQPFHQENIVIAATFEEVDSNDEARITGWDRSAIAFPIDWEFKKSKSMNLEFMRMAENRSKLTH